MEILSSKLAKLEALCFEKAWSSEQLLSSIQSLDTVIVVVTSTKQILVYPDSIIPSACDIIAFSLFQGTEPTDCLRTCVHPQYRRMGIATNMFLATFFYYQKKRPKGFKILLEVADSNDRALLFYQEIGFKIIHKRKKYYGKNDAFIMEWQ